MTDIAKRMRENIERVKWTLRDEAWQPSRSYIEKLLAAYEEAADEIERLQERLAAYNDALGAEND
jgi:hypothetical protein